MNDAPTSSDSVSEDGAVADPTDTAAHNDTSADAAATPESAAPPASPEPPAPPAPVGPPVALPPAGLAASPAEPTPHNPAPTATTAAAGAAVPAAPRTDGIVAKATDLARRVGTERALAAALNAAIVYGAAWAVSLVVIILALIAAADSSPDWGWAFEGPGQLVGLSVGGIFTLGATVVGVSAKVSVLWLPLLITAVVVAGAALLARRDERAHPSATRGIRWVRSVITGVALAVLVVLVAVVLPVRYAFGESSDGDIAAMMGTGGTGSSFSFTAFLGAVIIVTVASYLARVLVSAPRAARASSPLRLALASTSRAIVLYLAATSTLLALGLLIYSVIRLGVNALLTAPLWLPTAVVDGLGIVNLAPIGISGSATSIPGISDSQTSFWMGADIPGWVTIVILLVNLALIASAGIALALLRPTSRLSTASRWFTTVASFALAGVAISLLGGLTAWTSVDTSAAGETLDSFLGGSSSELIDAVASVRATAGLAAWTFIIFAVLGALVEAAAVYLAPKLIPLVPASLIARAARNSTVAVAPGTPAAAVAVSEGAAPNEGLISEVQPMTPERKRKVLIILASIGAAIVVVVAAAVTISIVNTTVYSPKNQVESYLDNLVEGSASGALAVTDVDADNGSRVLLTDDVLSATEGGITGYTITDVVVSGESATVTAEIDQDGKKTEVYYAVDHTGSTLLVFDNWKLDTQYVASINLDVPETVTTLLVNGVEVAIDDANRESGYVSLPAFPGEYVVEIGGASEYLSAEPQTAVISANVESYSEALSFTLEPTEAFIAEVTKQIDALVASCAAQGLIEADDCPIYSYAYGDVTNVVWTINTPATFEVADYGDGEWFVQTDERGSSTLTYTRDTAYSEPTAESDEVDFSVSGTVKMVDDAPVYTYGY